MLHSSLFPAIHASYCWYKLLLNNYILESPVQRMRLSSITHAPAPASTTTASPLPQPRLEQSTRVLQKDRSSIKAHLYQQPLQYYYLENNLIAAQAPGIQWSEDVKKKRDCIEKVGGRGAIELERVVLMLCDSKTLRG